MEAAKRSNTKLVAETVANPTLEIPNLMNSWMGKKNSIKTVVDNTFTSHIYLDLLSGHHLRWLATKCINGHGDVIGGAVVGRRHRD